MKGFRLVEKYRHGGYGHEKYERIENPEYTVSIEKWYVSSTSNRIYGGGALAHKGHRQVADFNLATYTVKEAKQIIAHNICRMIQGRHQ
jgi:hypothetical protein